MLSRQLKHFAGSMCYSVYGALWNLVSAKPKAPEEIKTVLIINLLRIGDTVVTLPTLKALRLLYPEAKITLVVRKMMD